MLQKYEQFIIIGVYFYGSSATSQTNKNIDEIFLLLFLFLLLLSLLLLIGK